MLGAGGEIDPFDFSYYMDQVSRCISPKGDQAYTWNATGSVDGAIKQSPGVSTATVHQTWREIPYSYRHRWLLYASYRLSHYIRSTLTLFFQTKVSSTNKHGWPSSASWRNRKNEQTHIIHDRLRLSHDYDTPQIIRHRSLFVKLSTSYFTLHVSYLNIN